VNFQTCFETISETADPIESAEVAAGDGAFKI